MKSLLSLLFLLLFSQSCFCLTFPISDNDLYLTKSGAIKTTRWFYLKAEDENGRYYQALNWPTRTMCPILAITSGQVIETGINPILGGFIKVKSDDPKIDYFVIGHISNWSVKVFERVKEGQAIAQTGHSGRTTLKPSSKHGLCYLEVWKDGHRICISNDFGKKLFCVDSSLEDVNLQ